MTFKFSYSYYEHDTHAGRFMRDAAAQIGFSVLKQVPQSITDSWEFEIDATPELFEALKQALREDHLASKAHGFFCDKKCLYDNTESFQ